MNKSSTRKLTLAKSTLRTLHHADLSPVVGGYNSNGCGTAYSWRGQITCDPGTLNPINPKGTING
jgi:hypothetical protein